MSSLERLKIPMLVATEAGEPVIVFELSQRRLLGDASHRVIYLPRPRRWIGQDAHVRGLLQEAPLPGGVEVVRAQRGCVVESRLLFPVGATEILRTEISFQLEEERPGEAGLGWAREVVLSTRGPEVRWDGEALEQVWGTGSRQRIVLEAPFEVSAEREPGVEGSATAWVHLRLTQRVSGGGVRSIALTLPVEASAVEALPVRAALHACVEAAAAAELLARLRVACAGHGVAFPWEAAGVGSGTRRCPPVTGGTGGVAPGPGPELTPPGGLPG